MADDRYYKQISFSLEHVKNKAYFIFSKRTKANGIELMRNFDYQALADLLWDTEVVNFLALIHEY